MRTRTDRVRLLEGKYLQEFRDVIRSPKTRDEYERKLSRFLEMVGESLDGFVAKAKADPRWAQDTVAGIIRKEKERIDAGVIEASTLRNFLKPVRLVCDIFELHVNWKRLGKMLPEGRRYALDRAPTIDELRILADSKDLRFRAILLMMVSGGFRIGSWDYLKLEDVEPIEVDGRIVAAKVRIYSGEPEEYYTFITPEAYRALQTYLDIRVKNGEVLNPKSPLLGATVGERIGSVGVKRLFERAFWHLGLRQEKRKRHPFSIHSIRKYFKTRCEQVMKPINVEVLMGHSTGISDNYYRPLEKDLLDDYLNAVPLLTISEAEEVRREAHLSRQHLEDRLRQVEDLLSRLIAERGQLNPSPDRSHNENTSNNNTPKKVVKAEEIEKFIEEGWEPIMTLADGRVIVKAAQH